MSKATDYLVETIRNQEQMIATLGARPASTNPDVKPRCSAHGNPRCPSCVRSKDLANIDVDGNCRSCFAYGTTGMHSDSCEYRVR